jgi:hypothetical protein
MTIARGHLVDASVTRWYRCVTRRVRRAFLLWEGVHDRKGLSNIGSGNLLKSSSLAVAGFAVLDNHLHVLVLSTRMWPRASRTRTSCGAGDAFFRRATRRARWPRSPRIGSRQG